MAQSEVERSAPKTEDDTAVYKTLLESTKAIPWKIDWSTMRFAYIGPQIESLLGWTPESWATVQDWVDRIHPDDREWVVDYCVAQSKAGVDHEADYRALAKDGSYVWLRDVVHVIRTAAGEVEALVGFMFDISERKRTEEQVEKLEKELEQLSFEDKATGLANRKWFDTLVDGEWAIARRSQCPLSLVMVAVDCFDRYVNHYGRIQADECVKLVGRALSTAATRPRDFVARYDEDVFVIALPETDEKGTTRVVERCRGAILSEGIPHDASPISGFVTLSVGFSTTIPLSSSDVGTFVEEVARALEAAKRRRPT
jgi:diguanylate cyclase (GGDEF)-like protein/PAS domain S-box-containing protein